MSLRAPNPRHLSGSVEYATPAYIVEPSRAVLGAIDLDPASCALANRLVRARRIFTRADDGLHRPWRARRLFVNPPGGLLDGNDSAQKAWWFKLARHHQAGDVEAAVFICFSIELLQVTQSDPPLGAALPHDFLICFPRSRVPYDLMKRGRRVAATAPPHASAVVFLPPRAGRAAAVRRFKKSFAPVGRVMNGLAGA